MSSAGIAKSSSNQARRIWLWRVIFLVSGIIGFLLMLLISGGFGKELFLPLAKINDEPYYYKQIEAMVSCTTPKGFFGYGGSSARYGGLALWSPVLMLPYVFLGKLFGWNYSSPIIYGMVIMLISYGIFLLICRDIDARRLILLSALNLAFTPVTRLICSGFADATTFSLVYLLIAVLWRIQNAAAGENTCRWTWLYGIISMILMGARPYFLLVLLPLFIIKGRAHSRKEILILVFSGIAGLVLYRLLVVYFMCGAVFSVGAAGSYFARILNSVISLCKIHYRHILSVESLIYLLLYTLFVMMVHYYRRHRRHAEDIICSDTAAGFALSLAGILLALMMFFGMDNTRHALVICLFAVLGIIVLFPKKYAVGVTAAVAVIFFYTHFDPLWGFIPTAESSQAESFVQVDDAINAAVQDRDDRGWDATIVVPLFGYNQASELVGYDFNNMLHAPKGYGIQLYIRTDPAESVTNSRYYMAVVGSSYDQYYSAEGFDVCYENETLRIYRKPD